MSSNSKRIIIAATAMFSLLVYYGLILEPIFGQKGWIDVISGRFLYIPIIIATLWLGVRGGLLTAGIISVLSRLVLIKGGTVKPDWAVEFTEILICFVVALITAVLVKHERSLSRGREQRYHHLENSKQISGMKQISSGIAHEIKNPLNAIKNAIERANDSEISEEERVANNEILIRQVKRIDGTVNEFLAYAQPGDIKLTKIDLSETIRSAISPIEEHGKREGITIFSDIMGQVFINGDAEKIREMILNILLNAFQASGRGSTVNVTLEEQKDGMARIGITDNGSGISDEHIDKIFDPFYTVKSDGPGLGLAIVESIVEDHLGTVSINSRSLQGTTVEVLIPLYKASIKK